MSGTGKTTFALGLGAALAPLGTRTCYLSCEEDAGDLENRILTVTPPFLTRMANFAEKKLTDWFAAIHLDSTIPDQNRSDVLGFVEYVRGQIKLANVNFRGERAPGLVPLLVVLDGVHELINRPPIEGRDEVGEMRELVEEFRSLGVFVMILTAQAEDNSLKELDYLVDVVISLEHENRTKISHEPTRKLILHKTRLQYSWAGAHQIHISKRDGLKLYPQLPAQLEPYTMWRWKPMQRRCWYDFMQTGVAIKSSPQSEPAPLVRIFERSQTLVSGLGSSGKAGFSLKLLSAPMLPENIDEHGVRLFSKDADQDFAPRRILVASFLYPADYYDGLGKRLKERAPDQTSFGHSEIEIDTIAFYPGFISPEIFVSKILDRIKSAQLDGISYHGVMIDGLHNVFLQFPKLQENTLFWPVLYETFRIIGLTVVTTHTQFVLRGMERTPILSADVETVTHRIGPLLQAIVNAADFYINVTQASDNSQSARIEIVSALAQPVRKMPYFLNSQSMIVEFRNSSSA